MPRPTQIGIPALAALLCAILMPPVIPEAQGWNKAAHMVMAAVAYADLEKRNPAVLQEVVDILRHHPQIASGWADKLDGNSGDNDDLHLFMMAARWPDDIRGNRAYDKPKLHFINIPYRPGSSRMAIPKGPHILEALTDNLATLKSELSDSQAHAVALCWIFHLIGDLHQPLHTITLMTAQFPGPDGDRGGTRFYMRVTPGGATISLHKLWDGLIIGSDRPGRVTRKASELRSRQAFTRDSLAAQLKITSFNTWAKESHAIAVEHGYRNGSLEGSTDEKNGCVLPSGYGIAAKRIAEAQIVLSAYRLSDVLAKIFGR